MYLRKVIRISATDSPNIQLALAQQAAGIEPTNEEVLPGVITWPLYQHRRRTWDKVRQCVGLDGLFYEGASQLLYPPDWFVTSEERARKINIQARTRAKAMGVDTAEGGDKTCWAIVDEDGLIKLDAFQTPDTNVIVGRTIAYIRQYGIDPKNVVFDQGGGGQQHSDRLRGMGFAVQDMSFGETATPEPVRHMVTFDQKSHDRRDKFTYKNRRVQMYWYLHLRMDPIAQDGKVFAIPDEYDELRRQMAVMPIRYNEEGTLVLPPKHRRDSKDNRETIEDMLGCSPDETDALVLATFAMEEWSSPMTLRPMFQELLWVKSILNEKR